MALVLFGLVSAAAWASSAPIVSTSTFTGVTNTAFYDTAQKIRADLQIHQVFSASIQTDFPPHQKLQRSAGKKTLISRGLGACRGPVMMGRGERDLNASLLVRALKNNLFIIGVRGYYNQFSCSNQ